MIIFNKYFETNATNLYDFCQKIFFNDSTNKITIFKNDVIRNYKNTLYATILYDKNDNLIDKSHEDSRIINFHDIKLTEFYLCYHSLRTGKFSEKKSIIISSSVKIQKYFDESYNYEITLTIKYDFSSPKILKSMLFVKTIIFYEHQNDLNV